MVAFGHLHLVQRTCIEQLFKWTVSFFFCMTMIQQDIWLLYDSDTEGQQFSFPICVYLVRESFPKYNLAWQRDVFLLNVICFQGVIMSILQYCAELSFTVVRQISTAVLTQNSVSTKARSTGHETRLYIIHTLMLREIDLQLCSFALQVCSRKLFESGRGRCQICERYIFGYAIFIFEWKENFCLLTGLLSFSLFLLMDFFVLFVFLFIF